MMSERQLADWMFSRRMTVVQRATSEARKGALMIAKGSAYEALAERRRRIVPPS